MNKHIKHFLSLIILLAFIGSCSKNVGTNDYGNNIVGTTVTNGDTTTITVGNLIITAAKTSPCYPSTEIFTFTANASAISDAASFSWSFGDGHIATGQIVQHGYDNAAPFIVTLSVLNSSGTIIDAATFPVKAWGQQLKPVAIFSSKNDFPNNLNYITFNSASNSNHGSIINNFWDWGDGTTTSSALALIRHNFPTSTLDKTYQVKLRITTDAGCTADTSLTVSVPGAFPITGDFSAVTQNACTNESFTFTAQATNAPTGSVYYWHYSDGTHDDSGYNAYHSFAYMNDYDVIMYIVLNGRKIYTTHKVVNAKGPNPKPTASFYNTWESNDATQIVMSFNSQSTIQHGFIDSYSWNFGNGQTNNDFNSFVKTIYNKNNYSTSYPVTLIVTGNGCADTAYSTITIPSK